MCRVSCAVWGVVRRPENSKIAKSPFCNLYRTSVLLLFSFFWSLFALFTTSPASRKDQKIEAYFAASNHQAKTSSNVLQYCRQELGSHNRRPHNHFWPHARLLNP